MCVRNKAMLNSGRAHVILWQRYLAILIVAIFAAGCSSEGEGPGHRPQALALRPEQELKVGRAAYAELLSEASILRSGPEFDQVQRVSRRIAAAVQSSPCRERLISTLPITHLNGNTARSTLLI